ncbi:MAG: hypothetical protein AB7F09_17445 [Parvibaculaceae bacterium]
MIDRRRLMGSGLLAALAAFFAVRPGSSVAAKPPPIRRDNCSFANEVSRTLEDAVRRGLVAADAEQTVRCPLCREYITVSAREALERNHA